MGKVKLSLKDIEKSPCFALNASNLADNTKGGHLPSTAAQKLANAAKLQRGNKQKQKIRSDLFYWAKENKTGFKTEFVFHPVRHWQFDFALPDLKIAFEYEGIFSGEGGHNSVSGIMRDIEKYNEAQILGWRVFRLTANNYTLCLQILKRYLQNK